MRCRKALDRLNRKTDRLDELATDSELQKHLQQCPNCAREAKASDLLSGLMETAATGDRENLIPIEEQRVLVEARARQTLQRNDHLTTKRPGLARYLRYGGVLATAMIVVVMISMIPITTDPALGYVVSFDGVDLDLAHDDERICEMLYILGLHEAEVDLLGCDTTCNLMIVDLKTEAEANLVVAAMASLSDDGVTSNVIPITDQNLTLQ